MAQAPRDRGSEDARRQSLDLAHIDHAFRGAVDGGTLQTKQLAASAVQQSQKKVASGE